MKFDLNRPRALRDAADSLNRRDFLRVGVFAMSGVPHDHTTSGVPRVRDYSHTSGKVAKTSGSPATTACASPEVIGAGGASAGPSSGGGTGEEAGDGGGDGEPPIALGYPHEGDGYGPSLFGALIAILLLLFIVFCFILKQAFVLPIRLYRLSPDLVRFWRWLEYAFPDRVRHDIYLPHKRTLLRDLLTTCERPLPAPMKAWVWACLRARTAFLVLVCIVATFKDVFTEGKKWLDA